MDGDEAVQRATTWWESLSSDAAWAGPDILAGLITDLAHAVEDGSEHPVTKVTGLLSGLGELVQSRAQVIIDSASVPVQTIAHELGSMAKTNRQSLLRVADALRHKADVESVDGESVDRFRMVFDNTAVAIAVATGAVDGKIVEVNPAFADMFSTTVERLRGVSISHFADVETIGTDIREWVSLLRSGGGSRRFEVPYRLPDGTLRWALFIMTFVSHGDQEDDYVLAVAEDITVQRTRAEELQWQAHHDPLTGLPNRRYLQEQLRSAAAEASAGDVAGLCFVDVDAFKSVNDAHGHATGDLVLRTIAERLREAAHSSGNAVVRIGGDEFITFVRPPTSRQAVLDLAHQLLATFDEPISVDGQSLRVRASIGVDVVDLADTDPTELLDGADRALYETKADGRGVVVYQRS